MTADEFVEKIETLLPEAGGEWKYFYKPKYDEHHVSVRGDGNGLALAMFTDGCPFGEQFARYLEAVQPQNIALLLSDRASSAARMAELEKALQDIAESDDIENALDPARNKRVAIQALAARAALGGRSDG